MQTVETAIRPVPPVEGQTARAERLLREVFVRGPVPARTVEARVLAAGVSRGVVTADELAEGWAEGML